MVVCGLDGSLGKRLSIAWGFTEQELVVRCMLFSASARNDDYRAAVRKCTAFCAVLLFSRGIDSFDFWIPDGVDRTCFCYSVVCCCPASIVIVVFVVHTGTRLPIPGDLADMQPIVGRDSCIYCKS